MTTSQDTLKKAYIDAYDLMIESVLEPHPDLRTVASYSGCLDQLLDVRQDMLNQLQTERDLILKMTEAQVQAYLGGGAPGTPCNIYD